MTKIVPFNRKQAPVDADFNSLLRAAVTLAKQDTGRVKNLIFQLQMGFPEMLRRNMAHTLLEEQRISPGMFLCSAYVAKILGEFTVKVPDSFYGTDYLVRGHAEKNPRLFQEGADLCCFISIFLERRNHWRAMRPGDFQKMGRNLYLTYYYEAKKEIGWHMAKNFADIVTVAQRSLNKN